jgi:hypothetical protein
MAQRAVRRFDQFLESNEHDDAASTTSSSVLFLGAASPPPSSISTSTTAWSPTASHRGLSNNSQGIQGHNSNNNNSNGSTNGMSNLPMGVRRARTMSIDSNTSLFTLSDAQSIRSRSTISRSKDYCAAFNTLRDMFPNVDVDVCEVVLQANRGHLPPAIEALLEISNSIASEHDEPYDNEDDEVGQ